MTLASKRSLSTPPVAMALALMAYCAMPAASEPSYDCAKASGQVQELICANDALAGLDRKLAGVYAAALADFPLDELPALKAEQRGWIKGRDDCWKADNVGECVTRQYQARIVELQIQSGKLTAPVAASYNCGDASGAPLSASFYADTDPASVVLSSGQDQVIAFISPSGSGARYSTTGVEFWEHHGEATVNWFGTESKCTVIK